jgi:hypothetical protein
MVEMKKGNTTFEADKGGKKMGQSHQFRAGQKAPNNGVYIEVGDTGDNVVNPKMIKLKAGDHFPENSNDERHWTYKRKP